jgi:3-oxoadipate enol-lactonase
MSATTTTQRIRLDGVELQASVTGSGPWVTLSHALGASQAMWAPQVQALAARHTVLSYDIRGHGESETTPGPYTLEQLADDAFALLRHLGVARTHWVGLSLGGMIGQVMALRHPQMLDRVVVADSNAQVPPAGQAMWIERAKLARTQGMEALVEGTLSRWFTPDFAARDPQTRQQIGAQIAATPAEGYAACCAAICGLDTLDRLPGLAHPALVLVGEEDQATPVALSRQIAQAWPGAELVVLPGAAHLSNVEQPALFNRELLRFLG